MSEELRAQGWERLSIRKMALDPVKAIGSAIVPSIAVVFGLSSVGSLAWVFLLPVFIVIAALAAVVPWWTTWYRVTPTHFEVRRGLLSRQQSTVPLDRVRSVDLEANLLHRVLSLRKVEVGTGVDSERIELDAMLLERAEALRTHLLSVRHQVAAEKAAAAAPEAPAPDDTAHGTLAGDAPDPAVTAEAVEAAYAPPPPPAPEQLLATIDWSWLRFAPFSLGRLVVIAGALGVFSQLAPDIDIDFTRLSDAWDAVTDVAVWLLVLIVVLTLLVGWLAISVLGYVAQWWGLRLTRQAGSLHLTSGLFTTRSISVEESRVRGVELTEPALLRLVRGAELATLATGVGEGGSTKILPQCPVGVARDVAVDVLDDATAVQTPLVEHGPAARRRRHVRQQWLTLLWLVIGVVLHQLDLPARGLDRVPEWAPTFFFALATAWLVLGALAAESAYRNLGHALTTDHLVAGSGVLARVRTVLETDGIIGWVVTESFFQRRSGLATLLATTAAGDERVIVTDIPVDVAVGLAAAATPEPVRPFLTA